MAMKIKTNLKVVLAVSIFLYCSCSAISKQQKSAIKEMAGAGKAYTEAPNDLLSTYCECLYKSDNLEAALKRTPEATLRDLDRSVSDIFNITDFSSNLNQTYKLLNRYFDALLTLVEIDTAKNVKNNIATLGVNIDSLISKSNNVKIKTVPLGFGTIGGQLFQYIGKLYIRNEQLKYFKEFIKKGDYLVKTASIVLDDIIIPDLLKGNLEQRNKNVTTSFLRFIDSLDTKDKKESNYINSINPKYLEIKICFAQAIREMYQLAQITNQMSSAHKELLDLLNEKQGKHISPKIAVFVASVDELSDIIRQYKKISTK